MKNLTQRLETDTIYIKRQKGIFFIFFFYEEYKTMKDDYILHENESLQMSMAKLVGRVSSSTFDRFTCDDQRGGPEKSKLQIFV